MMSRMKTWLIAAALTLAAAMTGTYWFVESITSGNWEEGRRAVEAAYTDTMLAKAERVEPFVGKEPYQIVYGEDKLGHKMIVWVSESERHAAYEADGITEEQATALATAANPANRVLRATPGKWDEEYVWEVYYERDQDGATANYYSYYRYSDGALLETLRLR